MRSGRGSDLRPGPRRAPGAGGCCRRPSAAAVTGPRRPARAGSSPAAYLQRSRRVGSACPSRSSSLEHDPRRASRGGRRARPCGCGRSVAAKRPLAQRTVTSPSVAARLPSPSRRAFLADAVSRAVPRLTASQLPDSPAGPPRPPATASTCRGSPRPEVAVRFAPPASTVPPPAGGGGGGEPPLTVVIVTEAWRSASTIAGHVGRGPVLDRVRRRRADTVNGCDVRGRTRRRRSRYSVCARRPDDALALVDRPRASPAHRCGTSRWRRRRAGASVCERRPAPLASAGVVGREAGCSRSWP